MPKFKVLTEAQAVYIYQIDISDPQEESKLTLKEFLVLGSENELGFGVPLSKYHKFQIYELVKS